LGALGAYESQLFVAAQVLIAVAVLGHALAYLQHRKGWLLGLAILSGVAVFGGLYLLRSEAMIYAGFAGLVATSATDYGARFRATQASSRETLLRKPDRTSGIGTDNGVGDNLPEVRSQEAETMADGHVLVFLRVRGLPCSAAPKAGDCCVFCSYGSAKCPPKQAAGIT